MSRCFLALILDNHVIDSKSTLCFGHFNFSLTLPVNNTCSFKGVQSSLSLACSIYLRPLRGAAGMTTDLPSPKSMPHSALSTPVTLLAENYFHLCLLFFFVKHLVSWEWDLYSCQRKSSINQFVSQAFASIKWGLKSKQEGQAEQVSEASGGLLGWGGAKERENEEK